MWRISDMWRILDSLLYQHNVSLDIFTSGIYLSFYSYFILIPDEILNMQSSLIRRN